MFGGILSYGTLVAYHFALSPRFALPKSIDGALIMLPAVLALTVLTIAYPVFLAATRADAVAGAIMAFVIAADMLIAVSLVLGDDAVVHVLNRSLPLGAIAVGWSVPAAVIALALGQFSPLGFGRSAAFRSAATAFVLSAITVLAAARFT